MKNWEKRRTAPSGVRTHVWLRKSFAYLKPLRHSTRQLANSVMSATGRVYGKITI